MRSAFQPHQIPPLARLLGAQRNDYTTGHQVPRHIDDLIATAVARRDPGRAVDVGCNDGALLSALQCWGYDARGIEPNAQAADRARTAGHAVHVGYLTPDLAAEVAAFGRAGTVFCRHVIEHVADLDEFFAALAILLEPDGQLVVELPDIEEGLAFGSPSILWSEHLHYFTAGEAERLLADHGYRITDRRHYAFGGGAWAWVAELGTSGATWGPGYLARLQRLSGELHALVVEARRRGWTIVLYGAAPRSEMVVQASDIAALLDQVIDDRAGRQWLGHAVVDLDAAALGDKVLCLMGVGAENEWRIARRLTARAGQRLVPVSLLPPRDLGQSIAAASRRLRSAA